MTAIGDADRLDAVAARPDATSTAWRRRLQLVVPAVLAWLVGMVGLYGQVVRSGFDELHGDVGDERLLSYISEHWLHVLQGDASWRDPSYFFPVQGALGYTDTVVLYQPIYIPLRLLGVDQFVAFEITLMALSTIGFVSMLAFLRRFLAVRPAVAVAGAFVFAFANNVVLKIGHGQMSTLQLVPVVLLLFGGATRAVSAGRRGRAALLGGLGGLLFALLFLTSFYVGWFVTIGAGLTALLLVVVAFPVVRRAWRVVIAQRAAALTAAGATLVGFVVGIVPFLVTYLPILDETGGRSFVEVLSLSPRVGDLLGYGPDNLAWSWLLQDLPAPTNGERTLALTPILVLSAVGATLVLLLWRRSGASGARVRTATALLLAAATLTALSLRFGDWTAWHGVWDVVPGAKAIRVVGRIQVVIGGMVLLAWALVIDELWSALGRRAGRARAALVGGAVVALLVLVGFEQLNTSTFVHLDRQAELAKLASVPDPPAACASFYVVNPPPGTPYYVPQIDAMLISGKVGVPTLNGYSGVAPSGWQLFDATRADYQAWVEAWVAAEGVPPGLCSFDLDTRSWTVVR